MKSWAFCQKKECILGYRNESNVSTGRLKGPGLPFDKKSSRQQMARFGIPKDEFEVVVGTLLEAGFDFIDPRELFNPTQEFGVGIKTCLVLTQLDGKLIASLLQSLKASSKPCCSAAIRPTFRSAA